MVVIRLNEFVRFSLMYSKHRPIEMQHRVLSLALLPLLIGCGQSGVSGDALVSQQNTESPVFHLVTHAMPSDPFWSVVKKGWEDACQRYQIDGRYLGVRTDGNVGEMLGNLEAVVATGSDGIACVITDQQALEPPLRRAIANEVPVIALNVQDYREESQRIPYLTYVGEGSFETGQASARVVLERFQQLSNRPPKHAIYLIHATSIQCLEERGLGMEQVYSEAGSKFTKVACKFDPVTTQESLRAFLEANPDVEAVHSGCSQVAHWSALMLKKMGRLGNVLEPFEDGRVYVGGIDMDEQLLTDISRGEVIATIDQQPYLQGYLAAVLLFQYHTFGLIPSNDILTGPYVVDQSNALQRIKQIQSMR